MDKGNRRSVSSILDWKSKTKSSAILQSDDTPKDNLSPNAGSSQVSTPKSPSNAKGKEPWSLWKDKTAFPLCSDCRKLDFDRFRNPASFDQSTTTHETTLIDISTLIENYKDMQCGFCSLLFDAIAEHDPFQHPAIRDYISEAGLQKIGAGRSSNRTIPDADWKPTFGRDEKKELQRDLAFAAQTATANVAVMRAIEESNKSNDADVAGILSAVHEMFPAVLSLIKQFNKDSPAAVTVKEVNAGLFTVAHSCGVLREDMSAKDAGNGPPKTDFLSPPTIDRAIKYRERWGLEPIIRRSPLFTEYTKFLEQYTSRDLTMPSDILSGIMGLLNVLDIFSTSSAQSRTNKSNGDITLSGLPEGFLDLALLWQPPPAKQVGLTRRAVGERVFHRETPSWSWAGWDTWKEDLKIQNHPGVRHEDPFWVSTYEDPSLKKIHATQANAEERYRPLVMWYTTKKLDAKSKPDVGPKPADQLATPVQRTLRPVNDNGLGLHFQDSNKDSTQKIIQEFLKRAAQLRRGNTGIPAVPEGVYLKDHYLVCETEVAKFRVSQIKGFREEVLWHSQEKGGGSSKTLYIAELEIRQDLRGKDRAVGYVI
ncbi:hypothetical protein Brms1b_007724 [Colletotrichum noveboracense]|nr:hypothetical protein Brms1b_007724 [Colletotrichum noveboracense]